MSLQLGARDTCRIEMQRTLLLKMHLQSNSRSSGTFSLSHLSTKHLSASAMLPTFGLEGPACMIVASFSATITKSCSPAWRLNTHHPLSPITNPLNLATYFVGSHACRNVREVGCNFRAVGGSARGEHVGNVFQVAQYCMDSIIYFKTRLTRRN